MTWADYNTKMDCITKPMGKQMDEKQKRKTSGSDMGLVYYLGNYGCWNCNKPNCDNSDTTAVISAMTAITGGF